MENLSKRDYLVVVISIVGIVAVTVAIISVIVTILAAIYGPRQIHREMIAEISDGEYVYLTFDLRVARDSNFQRSVTGKLFFNGTEYRSSNSFGISKGFFKDYSIDFTPAYVGISTRAIMMFPDRLVLEFDEDLNFTEVSLWRLGIPGSITPQHFRIRELALY